MNRFWFVLCLCFAIAGCNKPVDQNTLIGRWKSPSGFAEEYTSGIRHTHFMGIVNVSKWYVVKMEGNDLTITTTQQNNPTTSATIQITFDGVDKMQLYALDKPDEIFEFERYLGP